MPNNTANKLTFAFYGDDEAAKIKEIESFLDSPDKELDFRKLIPIEGELDNMSCSNHWGTEWNSYGVHKIKPESNTITYFFETAWLYPEPILDVIFKSFPGVYISFATACEGGWFAMTMDRDSDGGEVNKKEWTTELGNDEGGYVRSAMHNALSI